MNRRNFLTKSTGALAAGLAMSPFIAKSEESKNDCLQVQSEISRNHGHSLALTSCELIQILRELENSDALTKEISIQGQSGHPHSIQMNRDQVLSLIEGQELLIQSSRDSGHLHDLSIILE